MSYSPLSVYALKHAHVHARNTYTTLEGGVRRRSNHPSLRYFLTSHSNRIVSIINETALGFSGEPRFRVTVFRLGVCVRACDRTRGCVRDAPYLFTHVLEYNCYRERGFLATRNTYIYFVNIHTCAQYAISQMMKRARY